MSRQTNSVKTQQDNTQTASRRKRAGSKMQMLSGKARIYAIAGTAAAIVLALVVYFMVMGADAFKGDVICRGVSVNGIDLSRMDKQAAFDAVYQDENPYADSKVTIKSNGKTVSIGASDIDAAADYEQTAADALAIGHSGNIFKDVFNAYKARAFGVDIGYSVKLDKVKFNKAIVDFSHEVGGTFSNHEIVIEDEYAMVIPGKEGLGMDTGAAKEMFMENFLPGESREIEVPYGHTEPADISAEEVYDFVFVTPVDAHYEKTSKTDVVVAEAVRGRHIDIDEAKKLLDGFDSGSKPVNIPFIFTEPEIKTEDLADDLFGDTLSTYRSPYNTANIPRTSNLKIAAANINGMVLLPGEEFSYNEVVGERTRERGFGAASVYENNRSVDGIGGGICQVSSTIYAAALYIDLEIIERHEHTLEVPYVPLGMDATVAWGYLDFKFKNNMPTPIKLFVSVGSGYVNVEFVGTDWEPEKTVKIENVTVGKTARGVTYEDDPELEVGKEKVESPGFDGYVVDTYKTVTVDGVEGERVKLHTSRYVMANKIIKKGTKEPEATPVPEGESDPASTEPAEGGDAIQIIEPVATPEVVSTPAPTEIPML